jgi:hypothetical protein
MDLKKYINIPVFLFSLALGVIFVTVYDQNKRVIYVYPTPENEDIVQYKDAADNCFEVRQEKTKCPAKSSKIKQIPVQP